jgi:hypothetical protein
VNPLTTNPGELMDYVNQPVGGGSYPAKPYTAYDRKRPEQRVEDFRPDGLPRGRADRAPRHGGVADPPEALLTCQDGHRSETLRRSTAPRPLPPEGMPQTRARPGPPPGGSGEAQGDAPVGREGS